MTCLPPSMSGHSPGEDPTQIRRCVTNRSMYSGRGDPGNHLLAWYAESALMEWLNRLPEADPAAKIAACYHGAELRTFAVTLEEVWRRFAFPGPALLSGPGA